jgi:hypothetical protein
MGELLGGGYAQAVIPYIRKERMRYLFIYEYYILDYESHRVNNRDVKAGK